MRSALMALLLLAALPALAAAQAPVAVPPAPSADPFARSQLAEPVVAGTALPGGTQLTVRGFVDAGYIYIRQEGPASLGGDLSWAWGNSQFRFLSQNNTFTVNQVELSLEGQRESEGRVVGGRLNVDYYPSRDPEIYQGAGTDQPFDVTQALVFIEWPRAWRTRVVLGRAPGFVTLEQEEAAPPELRLIGHTYVFAAGGGYPYGLQAITHPLDSLAIRLGVANGGMGGYSFFPGDDSTLNRPVARDADAGGNDQAHAKTGYGAIDYTVFDRAAEIGTLRLGLAGARNPGLTFDSTNDTLQAYRFSNVWAAYRLGSFEVRSESAKLSAFYETSLGRFEASMAYLLLSWYGGANHLVTLRVERMTFRTDRYWDFEGSAKKSGLSYRYRLADGVALKVEGVREIQSPQFYVMPPDWKDLTTSVFTTSLVYSF